MTPGPTMVPERVLLAMARPIIHHRMPAFEEIFAEVMEGLRYIFQTKNDVLLFAASGTGAMEGAVSNLLSPGDKALVIRSGKFGERWTKICESFGISVTNIDVPWGQAVDPASVKGALEGGGFKAIYFQASETSTGARHPVKEIAAIAQKAGVLTVVDAITAIGVFDLPMDKWGLDVVVTGSQKALMLPPGLAFAALSDRAWKAVEVSKCPKYYFDFQKERKNSQKNQSSYTPAISLIIGLRESLRMIREEGLEALFARHERFAMATREAAMALGLKLYASSSPSPALTAICAPHGIDGQAVMKTMRDSYGVTIAGGQDEAKGKIFRISHMGYTDEWNIILTIAALEKALLELGFEFPLGAGMKKAMEVLKE